jgi:formiminotetrahydrofolate cyclodeaminase
VSIDEFLESLAAKQPTPGGGSASALGGALGAALGSMAAQYTVGNPKYTEFDAAARAALEKLDALRRSLVSLMASDIGAYDSYRQAVALPKGTAEEKTARGAALAAAREASTRAPEAILAAAQAGLEHVDALSRAVNPNLAGDVASSSVFKLRGGDGCGAPARGGGSGRTLPGIAREDSRRRFGAAEDSGLNRYILSIAALRLCRK